MKINLSLENKQPDYQVGDKVLLEGKPGVFTIKNIYGNGMEDVVVEGDTETIRCNYTCIQDYYFEEGEEIEIKLEGIESAWYKRIYIATLPDKVMYKFACVADDYVGDYEEGNKFNIQAWEYARPIRILKIDIKIEANGEVFKGTFEGTSGDLYKTLIETFKLEKGE